MDMSLNAARLRFLSDSRRARALASVVGFCFFDVQLGQTERRRVQSNWAIVHHRLGRDA